MALEPVNYGSMQIAPADLGGIIGDVLKQRQTNELKQQYATDLKSAFNDGSPTAMAALALKYPGQAEGIKSFMGTMTAEQNKKQMDDLTDGYSALLNGRKDVALSLLDQHIKAGENTGEDTSQLQNLRQLVDADPKTAMTHIGFTLSNLMGGEQFKNTFENVNPAAISKTQSEAQIKQLEAEGKPTEIALGQQKTAEEIKSAQSTRENAQIEQQLKGIDRQIAMADSETKRQELQLKRDELVQKQQQTGVSATEGAQDTLDTLNNTMSTVDSLMNSPYLESSFGVGTLTGKVAGMIPGSESTDFNAQIETLKSQQFLAQAKQLKGMGALSDAEGARLERAVSSLDRDQSPKAFKNSLGVIKSTLQKAQNKLVASGKLPTAGGSYVMQHPVYGNVTEGTINKLLAQYPGATRDQVIQYLQQSGGKQ